jgi:hypothetical protein
LKEFSINVGSDMLTHSITSNIEHCNRLKRRIDKHS